MLTTAILLDKLAKDYESIASNVVTGGCRDYVDYKYQIGRLSMLRHVRETAMGDEEKKSASTADQG